MVEEKNKIPFYCSFIRLFEKQMRGSFLYLYLVIIIGLLSLTQFNIPYLKIVKVGVLLIPLIWVLFVKIPKFTLITKLVGLFALWALVVTLLNLNIVVFGYFTTFFSGLIFIFFILPNEIKNKECVYNLLFWILVICGVFIFTSLLFGILRFPFAIGSKEGVSYIRGIFVNPNPFGTISAFVIFLSLILINRRFNWGYIGLIILGAFGVITSFYRSVWIAMIIGMLFFILRKNKKIFWGILMLFILLLALVPYQYNPLELTKDRRVWIWKEGLELVKKNPFGNGLGNELANQWSIGLIGSKVFQTANMVVSGYIDILIELGIIGLILFSFIVGVILCKKSNGEFYDTLYTFFMVYLIIAISDSLFLFPTGTFFFFFWLIIMLLDKYSSFNKD